jgi:hypothetical protein
MSNNIKDLIKELVSKGEVEKAIAIFKDWSTKTKNPIEDQIHLLAGNFSRYRMKRNLIFGDDEKLDRDISRISYALIDLVNQVEVKDSTQLPNEIVVLEPHIEEKKESSFLKWVINDSRTSLIILIVGIIGVLLSLLTISSGVLEHGGDEKNFQYYEQIGIIAMIGNLIVSIIAFFIFSRSTKFNKERFFGDIDDDLKAYVERSKRAVNDFIFCWKYTWVGWFLLYLTFVLKQFEVGKYDDKYWGLDYNEFTQVLTNLFSNLSSLGLIGCFAVLYYRRKVDDRRHYDTPLTITVLIFLLIFSLLEVILFINIDNSNVSMLIFEIIVGIISAISIALLLGRLDSKFINTSIEFIFIVYIYAGIQPLSGFFDENILGADYKNVTIIVKSFALNYALFAKSLLFVLIFWLLSRGHLQAFLIRLNSIMKNLDG